MGIFKKIKKAAKKVVKVAKKAAPVVFPVSFIANKAVGLAATNIGFGDKASTVASLGVSKLEGPAVLEAAAGSFAGLVSQPQPTVQPTGSAGGTPMGLGNLLGGLGGILSTTGQFGGNIGAISQIGSGFLSGFLPAQGPVGGKQIATIGQPQIIPVMGGGPLIQGAGSAIKEFVAPALARISASLGKNISLRAAMIIIRRLGKFLQSPAAIAAAIGLSVAELSTIMVANSMIGSGGKRMNVGNVKALRRAHRRIRGFHRLCADNDELKRPRRRSVGRKAPVVICK